MTGLMIILALVAIGTANLAWISTGKIEPLRDDAGVLFPGSISEKVFVDIGGIQQGMFIQSTSPANPVLLFLHGGPGMPEYFMDKEHPTGLERHFTMVWWEQRGAGMSFTTEIPLETMTLKQMIADTVDVADYLRARFRKEKVILLGHSWGSYLGIQVAAKAPDRFHFYVGMAQIVHQLRSEIMAREYLIGAYRGNGDERMARRLEDAPVSLDAGLSPAWMQLRDKAMHRLGVGNTHNSISVITGIFLPIWRMRAYTIREKINVWRGKLWSQPFFWEALLRDDLAVRLTQLDLPVYFFVGRYDYTANNVLSRSYFDCIEAPRKGFYLFENSAHSPLFEEPDRAKSILLDLVDDSII